MSIDDPEERFEFLLDRDVVVESDGRVALTEAYDRVRGVYHDTYAAVDEGTIEETVASLFDLSVEDAREQIDEHGITREEVIAYLALGSYLDDKGVDLDRSTQVLLAAMVADVSPESPVPDSMRELGDEEYGAFLESNPDAVLFVWKLHCDPCDVMKGELDETLATLPEGVAVAGVDGEDVTEFRREFDVEAAPATLTFADGEFVECVTGRRTPDQFAEMFANAYGHSTTAE
jgi:thiol-disulfide isomerase/thioredoxin